MQPLIQLSNISKTYGGRTILDHVDLSINSGDSIAFVGRNGIGKSTLLKLIAGLIQPDSGTILYKPPKPLFHYIPESFPREQLSARKYLQFMAEIDGLASQDFAARLAQLAADFFISDLLDIPLKHLSKGSLQKIAVLQALLVPQDILLLDEPVAGQDQASQRTFIHKMQTLQQAGTTLIMSCHEPYLIRALADTVYEIIDGQPQPVALTSQAAIVYHMRFITTKERTIPSHLAALILKQTATELLLTVPEKETNAVIQEMLQAEWILREMYVEKDL